MAKNFGMKIGQVSRKYGLSKDNIYYYINYGLLVPPKLNSQYVFDDETIRDLEEILALKSMDYSLSEIHRIISLHRISSIESPGDKRELMDMYSDKRAECAVKVKHYEAVIKDLDERIMGNVEYKGEIVPAAEAMKKEGITPVQLVAKEGLALNNGTQMMTAVGVNVLWDAMHLQKVADIACALTAEALHGITKAYDHKVHVGRYGRSCKKKLGPQRARAFNCS